MVLEGDLEMGRPKHQLRRCRYPNRRTHEFGVCHFCPLRQVGIRRYLGLPKRKAKEVDLGHERREQSERIFFSRHREERVDETEWNGAVIV